MLDKEPFRRVRFESHFLLVAIGNVIKLRKVFFDLTNDPRLAEAQREFDAAAPDAKTFGTCWNTWTATRLGRAAYRRLAR